MKDHRVLKAIRGLRVLQDRSVPRVLRVNLDQQVLLDLKVLKVIRVLCMTSFAKKGRLQYGMAPTGSAPTWAPRSKVHLTYRVLRAWMQ